MLRSDFPRLTNTTVALDFETYDPNLQQRGSGWCFPGNGRVGSPHGHVAGVALAWGQEKGYWPVGHAGGGNLPEKNVRRWLYDLAKDPSITWVMHNRMYDEGWFWRWVQTPIKGTVYDTATAAPLLFEYGHFGLDALGEQYLDARKETTEIQGWIEEQRKQDKKAWAGKWSHHIWRVPGDIAAPYGTQDAALTLRLWETFAPKLSQENLWPIFQLETDLLPVLLSMRQRGIRVDEERAAATAKRWKIKSKHYQQIIDKAAGREISANSEKDLTFLFDKLKIKYGRTPTGKGSFTKALFAKYKGHPVVDAVAQTRRYDKGVGTFINGYVFKKVVNGRVHPEFVPLPTDEGGAVTGRSSSKNPNYQNLTNPEKDPELGTEIRGVVLPEEGHCLSGLDYSQQEPRLALHYAVRLKVRGALRAQRMFLENPATDFHQMVADIAGIERPQAKVINLSVMYGQGEAATCRALGLPTEWEDVPDYKTGKMVKREVAGPEGRLILETYDAKVPWVRGLSDKCKRVAKWRGYIRTVLGRRCRFSVDGDIVDWPYKSMNKLIQGSAGDQTKKAMIEAHRAGILLLAPVHDELVITAPDPDAIRTLKQIMEECVPLEVPSKVDVTVGPSWGDAVEIGPKEKYNTLEDAFTHFQQAA